MKHKIIDGNPMKSISECIIRFENYGRQFPSPDMYRSVLKNKVEMSGSVFRFSNYFRNASTDAVHILQLP